MTVRTRFAPSPTGPLHIGGLRTALFNYLYAKKNKGAFVLRIEDTDQIRCVKGSEAYILKALEWCGLNPDEGPVSHGAFGPYRQSERKEIYARYIKKLIENNKAYYAFDSNESLEKEREEAEASGVAFKYGAHNRKSFKNSLTITPKEIEALKETVPYVVRLKVDPCGVVSVRDEIRGTIRVNSKDIDDKILMKSDGMPTYHFANVIDDHLMEISCVIRGEEWLPSLPLHQLIYEAFDWAPPKFMHLPLILKPTGKGKLSKRDGEKKGFPVFPLDWGENIGGFKERGFLPEGLVNYLSLLGWNDGTEREFFSLEELIQSFSVEKIHKGGARFDYEKAKWINHQHIQKKENEALMSQFPEYFKDLRQRDPAKAIQIVELIKERLYTLEDLETETSLFLKNPDYDKKAAEKLLTRNPVKILTFVEKYIRENDTLESLKEDSVSWAEENEIPVGALMQTFRISIVGRLAGPDLFKIIKILENDVILERVSKAIVFFNALKD